MGNPLRGVFSRLSRLCPRRKPLLSLDLQDAPAARVRVDKAPSTIETDAILGVDLGTSCTKVVVRTPYLQGGEAFAIPFDELAHPSSRYLIPTSLSMTPDGAAVLARSPKGETWATNMKYRLFLNPHDLDAASQSASYLALVLRLAKTTYLRFQAGRLPNYTFKWHLNLGIPSAGYDDQNTRESFYRVAMAAFALAEEPDRVTLLTSRRILISLSGAKSDHVNIFPEIAVEAVGYARSPFRRNGLHVLVDVGATTLDVCGFILHEREGEDRYSLCTAVVQPLGTHRLHERRMQALRGIPNLPDHIHSLDLGDPLNHLPDEIVEYMPPGCYPTPAISMVDQAFREACEIAIRRVIHFIRHRKDPYSPCWSSGLSVYLAGGGGGMRIYKEAIRRVSDWSSHFYDKVAPFQVERMPNLRGLSNSDIGDEIACRLGVAYGLSFHALEIGTIEAPSEVDPVPPRPPRRPFEMVSKEQT